MEGWPLEVMGQCNRGSKHSISYPHQVCNLSRSLAELQFSFSGNTQENWHRCSSDSAAFTSWLDFTNAFCFSLRTQSASFLKWVQSCVSRLVALLLRNLTEKRRKKPRTQQKINSNYCVSTKPQYLNYVVLYLGEDDNPHLTDNSCNLVQFWISQQS